MSYQTLPASQAQLLTLSSIQNNPDKVVPHPNNPDVIGFLKAASSGPSAYAQVADTVAFWEVNGNSSVLKFSVHGGGCDQREFGCVITEAGQLMYEGVRVESQACPDLSDPQTRDGVVLLYTVTDPGSGFTKDDLLIDIRDLGPDGLMFGINEVSDDGTGAIVSGWLSKVSGGTGYSVGDVVTLRGSDFPNTTNATIRVDAIHSTSEPF